jgi:PAS domain S-box-containing protein
MPQFIWTGDFKGNLNYFNQAVFKYSGLSEKETKNNGWIQIIHPDEREENIKQWMQSVNTGKDFLFEHRFRRKDGQYRWQLSRAVPQRDETGKIQMWVGSSTDIQEIKEQDQQKDYFISLASHELKTPITSIKAYTQMLQATYSNSSDAFLTKSLGVVDKQIVKLTNLISDLLDLSKIKSGSLTLHKENFQVNEFIQETIDEIKHINPDYEIAFSKGVNTLLYADRDRIGQVLINLLTNAIKYSPQCGKIKVESLIKNNTLIVSVEDYGIGINKDDQQKIFERFYRVEGRNEKTFPGFGIGLFISMEIIRRHNGNIAVKSELGKGSLFYFSIPLVNYF